MGVDAEVYLWGDAIDEVTLLKANEALFTRFGEAFGRYRNKHIDLCTWFDEVPGTFLYDVDVNGARYFYEGRERGDWGTIGKRIRAAQELFPNHFIIYTNDSSNMEDFEHKVFTDEEFDKLQAWSDELTRQRGW